MCVCREGGDVCVTVCRCVCERERPVRARLAC